MKAKETSKVHSAFSYTYKHTNTHTHAEADSAHMFLLVCVFK